jgi:hypothetical protein
MILVSAFERVIPPWIEQELDSVARLRRESVLPKWAKSRTDNAPPERTKLRMLMEEPSDDH